jgi:hypothetical protein
MDYIYIVEYTTQGEYCNCCGHTNRWTDTETFSNLSEAREYHKENGGILTTNDPSAEYYKVDDSIQIVKEL